MTSPHVPRPLSWWVDTAPGPDRRGRALPAEADVVVVGAGIAGLTTADRLTSEGRSVLVLEAREVASGVSGNTTAKVTAQHGLIYDRLRSRVGAEGAAVYAEAQLRALAWIIEQQPGSHGSDARGIESELVRADSYVYAEDAATCESLVREAEAAQEAGLPASYVTDSTDSTELDLPFKVAGAVRFTDQARFHPRRWLLGLADRIEALGGQVIEGVRVTQVHAGSAMVVDTEAGQVRANEVVIATHHPILDRGAFFARLEPTRDLVVSGPPGPKSAKLEGMYLDATSHYSFRPVGGVNGAPRELIVGGEHYRPGERIDVRSRFETLAGWARERLGVKVITHSWSAHDLSTPDGIPYVGRYHPRARHLWVATGFGQWGMTGGTAAGLLLSDLLMDKASEQERDLFDPQRINARSIPSLAKYNGVVAAHLFADMTRAALHDATETLDPDQASVCRVGTDLVAAYRDETGKLHAVSAHCSHLGCVVAFNNAERSWDCPCHGSRFGLDGDVLNGPAVQPLGKVDPPSD